MPEFVISRTEQLREWSGVVGGKMSETVELAFDLPPELAETVREKHSDGDLRLSVPSGGE